MANNASEALFSPAERLEFEMRALYPLAGIDTSLGRIYFEADKIMKALGRAEIDLIRNYLDAKIDREKVVRDLTQIVLYDETVAMNLVEFYEDFRSYNITYRVGEDLVRRFVEDSTTPGDLAARRARYVQVLTTPYTPSALSRGL
jgi:hypothetical protein